MMDTRRIGGIQIPVSPLSLGTWAFGGDVWWGKQEDKDSQEAMAAALDGGVTLIDTAPVYGRGRSESIVGGFLEKRKLREKVILASKLGLSWRGPEIIHNLSKNRMLEELDESRQRLRTDYFDLYQVHFPDPDTPVAETAETMRSFYEKGVIKSVGVSNFSTVQMSEFMKYCPLHCLQQEYSMFNRDIEKDILPFCVRHNIAVLSYAPLYSGLLTGKFFLDGVIVPDDRNRRFKQPHFREPFYSVNKNSLKNLRAIAQKQGKTLTQLAINWNFTQKGVTSAIAGARNKTQVGENLGSLGDWLTEEDQTSIKEILDARDQEIGQLAKSDAR